MKKYMILFSLGILGALFFNKAFAFFIPKNALQTPPEKLPPIVRTPKIATTYAKPSKNKRIKEYIAVDGYFIPVFEEIEEVEKVEEVEEVAEVAEVAEAEEIDRSEELKEAEASESINSKEEIHTAKSAVKENTETKKTAENQDNTQAKHSVKYVSIPKKNKNISEVVDQEAPKYKNYFAQYRQDLKAFEETKVLPDNEELNKNLEKMKSNKETVFSENTL